MFNDPRHAWAAGTALGSLVVFAACISSMDALGSAPRVRTGEDFLLSARVAAIAASARQNAPARLGNSLRAEIRVAQWRN